MPPVVLQEAIIFTVMTQEQFAVITVPKCVVSLSRRYYSSDTDVVCPLLALESGSYRIVCAVVLLVMWPTRTLSRAVIPNETVC